MLISEDLLWIGLYSLQLTFESKDKIPPWMVVSIFILDLIATTGMINNLNGRDHAFNFWVIVQGINVILFRQALNQRHYSADVETTTWRIMTLLLVLQAVAILCIGLSAFIISKSWNALYVVIISFLFSIGSFFLKAFITYKRGNVIKKE